LFVPDASALVLLKGIFCKLICLEQSILLVCYEHFVSYGCKKVYNIVPRIQLEVEAYLHV